MDIMKSLRILNLWDWFPFDLWFYFPLIVILNKYVYLLYLYLLVLTLTSKNVPTTYKYTMLSIPCLHGLRTPNEGIGISNKSVSLGQCGRQNMLQPYLKIWEWEWIFGCAVKVISSSGVRSPWLKLLVLSIWTTMD